MAELLRATRALSKIQVQKSRGERKEEDAEAPLLKVGNLGVVSAHELLIPGRSAGRHPASTRGSQATPQKADPNAETWCIFI